MIHINRLTAVIGADISDLNRKLDQAEQRINRYRLAVEKANVDSSRAENNAVKAAEAVRVATEKKTKAEEEYAAQLKIIADLEKAARTTASGRDRKGAVPKREQAQIDAAVEKSLKLKIKETKATLDLIEAQLKLDNANIELRKKQLTATEAVNRLTAALNKQKNASADLEKHITSKLNTTLDGLSNKLHSVGIGLTASLTFPIAMAGKQVLATGLDFETSMNKMMALTSMSTSEVEKWSAEILKLGPVVGKSPRELAEAMYFVASANISGADSFKILDASARASAAGMGDISELSKFGAISFKAYGESLGGIRTAFDQLIVAVKLGMAEPDKFAVNLGKIIGVAAQMKIPFNQILSFMASASNVGIPLETAAVGLRTLISDVLRALGGAKNVEVFKKMGIDIKEFAVLMSRDLQGALELFESKAKLLSDGGVEATKWFVTALPHARAFNAAISQVGTNASSTRDILNSMGISTGELDKAFSTGADSTVRSVGKMGASLEALRVTIFKDFEGVIQGITTLFNGLANIIMEMPAPFRVFLTTTVLLSAAMGPLAFGLSLLIKGFQALKSVVAFLSLAKFTVELVGAVGAVEAMKVALSPLVLTLSAWTIGIAAATAAIVGICYWVKNLSSAEENATKQMEAAWLERKKEIESQYEQLKVMPKVVAQYEELTNNTHRTKEETALLADLRAHILATLPEVITGIDAEGNAYLVMGNKVDYVTKKLNEMARAKRIADLVTTQGDALQRARDARDEAREKLEQMRKGIYTGRKIESNISDFNGGSVKIDEMVTSGPEYIRAIRQQEFAVVKLSNAYDQVADSVRSYVRAQNGLDKPESNFSPLGLLISQGMNNLSEKMNSKKKKTSSGYGSRGRSSPRVSMSPIDNTGTGGLSNMPIFWKYAFAEFEDNIKNQIEKDKLFMDKWKDFWKTIGFFNEVEAEKAEKDGKRFIAYWKDLWKGIAEFNAPRNNALDKINTFKSQLEMEPILSRVAKALRITNHEWLSLAESERSAAEELFYFSESFVMAEEGFKDLVNAAQPAIESFQEINRAIQEGINNLLQGSIDRTKEKLNQVRAYFVEFGNGVADLFSDLMYQIAEVGFKGLFDYIYSGFKKLLFRMAVEYFQSSILQLLMRGITHIFGAASPTSGGGNAPAPSNGLSNGSSSYINNVFNSNNLNNPSSSLSTPSYYNENTISGDAISSNSRNNNAQSITVNVQFNINSPDSASFRASQNQLYLEASAQMTKAARRLGSK